MTNILDYIFIEPFPWPWLVQDIIAILLSIFVLVYIIRRNKHPVVLILEAFAFIFLYASIYENAAVTLGLYSFGRSLVMIGPSHPSLACLACCKIFHSILWPSGKSTRQQG